MGNLGFNIPLAGFQWATPQMTADASGGQSGIGSLAWLMQNLQQQKQQPPSPTPQQQGGPRAVSLDPRMSQFLTSGMWMQPSAIPTQAASAVPMLDMQTLGKLLFGGLL